MELNPTYARVRFNNGQETSVSIRDLAPCCEEQNVETDVPGSETRVENKPMVHFENDPEEKDNSVVENPANESCESTTGSETINENDVILPHRSTRARKPVDRHAVAVEICYLVFVRLCFVKILFCQRRCC